MTITTSKKDDEIVKELQGGGGGMTQRGNVCQRKQNK